MKIAVHLAEGFEEIEAICIIDVLRRAGFDVITVSVTGDLMVTGSHDIPVIADGHFENIDYNSIDMIVLPGGMPGAKNLNSHEGLKNQILQFNESGKPLGAICAAPLVFGKLGILKGKNATCYPGNEEYLEGAEITGSPTEVAGNIITGKGAGVAIDFALKIVEQLKGEAEAKELAEKMVVKQ
jgi:4-methyl-5(b-hydroxyethyl)-thiazole monophosphate biosynthesis